MKILILSGSARRESFNAKLAELAVAHALGRGVEVDYATGAQLRELPMFDQDQEAKEGMPGVAKALKHRFQNADAVVLACPEYNSSVTPLLKNALDWVSRPEAEDEPDLIAYKGKVAGLLSASPGRLGGLRGLVHVRSILGNIGVLVVPTQLAVPQAMDAFDDEGKLKDAKQAKSLTKVVDEVIRVATSLA
ncbi:MAG TPA: NAD(P)H-dependent oxidoreductase [Luteolibacter sp.]